MSAIASPSVSILISYNAPGAKGSVVVCPGGFTEKDGCTLKTSIDLAGVAWLEERVEVGHVQAGIPVGEPEIGTGGMVRHLSPRFTHAQPHLTDVVTQAIFCIAGLVKTALHQDLDPLLC